MGAYPGLVGAIPIPDKSVVGWIHPKQESYFAGVPLLRGRESEAYGEKYGSNRDQNAGRFPNKGEGPRTQPFVKWRSACSSMGTTPHYIHSQ